MEGLAWVALGLMLLYVLPLAMIHPLARRWLAWWHGTGGEGQFTFYRCEGCHRLISHRRIRAGGCWCGQVRLRPGRLTLIDKARLLYLPWWAA